MCECVYKWMDGWFDFWTWQQLPCTCIWFYIVIKCLLRVYLKLKNLFLLGSNPSIDKKVIHTHRQQPKINKFSKKKSKNNIKPHNIELKIRNMNKTK